MIGTINYDTGEVLADGIVVAIATPTRRGWRWHSPIWMRTSRRQDFPTRIDATSAAAHALRVPAHKNIFTPVSDNA